MPAIGGVTFLLEVNTGTDAVPVYTAAAGGRNATLNLSVDEIDITSKDSNNWHEGLPSIRSWSIDFDELFVENDNGLVVIQNMYFNNVQLKVRCKTPLLKTFSGKVTLTDFSLEGPYDGEMTVSGTLQGTGALVYA